MKYRKILSTVLNWGSIGFACWYAGMLSGTPKWGLYGALALVGIASRASGSLSSSEV